MTLAGSRPARAAARALCVGGVLAGLGAPPLVGQAERFRFTESFSSGIGSWEVVRLDRRPTAFSVTELGGNRVLVATSHRAAAGLVRRLETGPPVRANLRWRWRISKSLTDNLRERERGGDDYAARVFVLFGDRPFRRGTRAVSYVWAGQEAPGSRYRNPVVKDVATVVLRSGDGYVGRWMDEQRDPVEDYRLAFGEPPPPIRAIAVVVDTDDTNSDVVSWFDDFLLEVEVAPPRP